MAARMVTTTCGNLSICLPNDSASAAGGQKLPVRCTREVGGNLSIGIPCASTNPFLVGSPISERPWDTDQVQPSHVFGDRESKEMSVDLDKNACCQGHTARVPKVQGFCQRNLFQRQLDRALDVDTRTENRRGLSLDLQRHVERQDGVNRVEAGLALRRKTIEGALQDPARDLPKRKLLTLHSHQPALISIESLESVYGTPIRRWVRDEQDLRTSGPVAVDHADFSELTEIHLPEIRQWPFAHREALNTMRDRLLQGWASVAAATRDLPTGESWHVIELLAKLFHQANI